MLIEWVAALVFVIVLGIYYEVRRLHQKLHVLFRRMHPDIFE